MRKPTPQDLKELNLLKHYRIIRKWACKANGLNDADLELNDADLELLIYLDSLEHFTKQDFKTGQYSFSWDNRRWNKLLKNDWIVVWRHRNRTTQKYNIYKTSFKFKHILSRIYRIMLGEEDLPDIKRKKSYTDKVMAFAMANVNNDKTR
jgi:hypothetical protein